MTRTASPARRSAGRTGAAWTVLAWLAGLLFFLPVAWMVLTGFKREVDAASNPPSWFFTPVLDGYRQVFDRDITPYLLNSVMASVLSTLLVLVLATPAAYALSIRPVERWRDVLFFFISTKMLPVVAALLPIYLLVQDLGMLDNVWTLIVLYTAMNLPLAVWMMRSFLLEVPAALIEAAAMDGADLLVTIRRILLPIVAPGLAATALICFIFSWNEFFFAVNLTATRAGTSPIFLVGFITSEGLFLARLCAAATIVSLPVVLAGWIAQKQLVRGLSMGAVK
ncbi:carbohydrate ABC transporter permease [Verrucosispora sp. WMMD703]|uniref:carbohydrate ABC transporter permease n=1 Tax=unclassified Micromonospora TaxID=2617518 RepID=UPI001B394520|nr:MULTISPECIES: carbohydrate ABC transporter permease [unclassified Micromonospora]MBQ1023570.1 carbohydrate ABC transporter permease [Micromonospora sp. C95]MBQ1049054.1 carbohydrate ABC transporter permease [Micromonospora sp. C51]WFE43145.1 carbohydrate ABC transporter permease [Verrucosispora sp. WMMD1129]